MSNAGPSPSQFEGQVPFLARQQLDPSSPWVRVYLLDTFRLEWLVPSAGQEDAWNGRVSARSVFKLLLCAPHRRASRSKLLGILWPELEEAKAQQALRSALKALRKVLTAATGEVLLEAQGDLLRLAGQERLWCDADVFEDLVQQADHRKGSAERRTVLEQARTLVREELLATENLEEWQRHSWIATRRSHLRAVRRRMVRSLADIYIQQGEQPQAEALLAEHVTLFPTDQDALIRLMRLLLEQQCVDEALSFYERGVKALSFYGKKPGQPLKQLEAFLRSQDNTASFHTFMQMKEGHASGNRHIVEVVSSEPESSPPLLESSSPAPSLASVIQLPQIAHVALSETDGESRFVQSESGLFLPPAPFIQTSFSESAVDITTWFGVRVNDLKALGAAWNASSHSCKQQQAMIHAEIEGWNHMTDQDDHTPNNYHITRRTALATLAALSTALVTKVQRGTMTTPVAEEFLAQCATSITACHHLMRGDGLATVEYALPSYLPTLASLAKEPSRYQKTAAYLAAQGYWLQGLIALHRLRLNDRVVYGKQAVEFARISEDRTLLITLLASLGSAWWSVGQQAEVALQPQEVAFSQMLWAYQQAQQTLSETQQDIPFLVNSKVFAGLAHAYAQQGNVQDALRWIGEARTTLSDTHEDVPMYLSTDYGLYQVILYEGHTFLALDKYYPNETYSKEARKRLTQIETVPGTTAVPERIRLEILNQRALAEVRSGNLEAFEHFLLEGAQGAQTLGSEKRRQEVITNWKIARQQWPHEKRVFELADAIV